MDGISRIAAKFSIALLLVLGALQLHAQSCKSPSDLTDCALGEILAVRAPGGDGNVHVTYAFTGPGGFGFSAPPLGVSQAVTAAFQNWNQYSSVTGIVFDQAPSSVVPDIAVMPDSNTDDTHGCAAKARWQAQMPWRIFDTIRTAVP